MEGVQMAIYRTISMSFWTDSKVVDEFTPEDKYFYLYLFTNPHTNLCGCYEVSVKQMAYETGYSMDSIDRLLKRFEEVHKVIHFSKQTKELLLLNWHKYNWTASDKFRKPLMKEISEVKCEAFKNYLQDVADGKEPRYGIDTTCIDTTVTVTDTNTNNINNINNNNYIYINNSTVEEIDSNTTNNSTSTKKSNSDNEADEEVVKEVIGYLNARVGANYRPNTAETIKLIHGRLSEGRTIEDFKYVIDVKADEWIGTSQEQYLRPKTLFAQSNFENYLQQRRGVKKKNKRTGKEPVDWDELTEWARKKDQEALEGDIVYDQ